MQALSPRSANIQVKPRIMAKDRAPKEAEAAPKTKVHASPPPALIVQPPEETGGSEIIYRTGKELGKGGFAICYEGHQRGKSGSTVYALKIVKSKFPQKKLEDKVRPKGFPFALFYS